MGFGGAERLVHDIAAATVSKGVECNVICLDAITGNTKPLSDRGILIELIKRGRTPFGPQVCGRLIRSLKASRATLIHAHDLASLAYAVPAGLTLRIPVVMTEHSRHYIEERLVRRMEKHLLCLGVSALVDVSPELAQASIQRDRIPSGKVVVIENGVDLELFAAASRERLRCELAVKPDEILLGMVGRLEEIKGPGVLLEAFARLAGDIAGARLVFVGGGSQRRALEDRARALGLQDRTHFTGTRSDIPEVMAALDILVLPSLSEGLPFALLEGMAAGRAVVSSAVGAIPRIIRTGEQDGADKENGVLVAPGDHMALSKALAGLLLDEPRRLRLGRMARQYVAHHYDKRVMLEKYEEVYARALFTGRDT
jgi:glycosyltransferase involved in cell wall biosynthesis